jgi:hypothetical protein
MGMFDEADEITLPFGSLHQFQTILNVMENQELVLKDEPNRLSFVKAEQDGRFLRDPCGRFHSEDEMVGNVRLYDVHRDGQAGGHRKHRLHYRACGRDHDC